MHLAHSNYSVNACQTDQHLITEQFKTTLNVEGMFELEAGSYYEDLVTLQIIRGKRELLSKAVNTSSAKYCPTAV